ncbi:MAG: sulfatase [Verrucomicrobiota bacterium]
MKTCLLFLSLVVLVSSLGAGEKPNFLFVIADDCTFRDIGCYGGQARTPHIDKLATEGMRFTRCFQAAPMCSPTRHNIYTGLYPVKSGAYRNHTFAEDGTKSVCHFLGRAGYRVALSGKTHIKPEAVFPFEYSVKEKNPDMGVIDGIFADTAAGGEPFCVFACSNEPHTPWDKGDPSQYDAASLKLPPYFADTAVTREQMTKYLAEITYYDSQVGELMGLLDKHGLADNTVVVVVSEQGSSFPFAKWTCYDSGLQSACIVRWPGMVEAGSVSDAMIEYVDVLPTFLDAAGLKRPKILDGESFVPVLKGETTEHKEFVYGIMTTKGIINGSDHYGIRSVRSGQYKYIVNLTPEIKFQNACVKSPSFVSWMDAAAAGDEMAAERVKRYQHRPGEELYDVVADPYEWTNLADNPAHAEAKETLKAELERWMKDCGDLGQATELAAPEHQGRNRNKKKPKAGGKKKAKETKT